jgi:hypothetical protein
MRSVRKLTGVGLVLCALPAVCVVGASVIAGAQGCALNEGSVNPCVVAGHDVGGLLYGMFLMGWGALFTIPIAALLLVFWIGAEGVNAVRRRGS